MMQGLIAGCGLDVYEFEPQIHPELKKLRNCVLLPHIGSASTETRTRMAIMASQSIADFAKGKTPPNIVKL
jgi:glyoxylate reductase